jgi:N-sulfoglucosamine sulfohydrolase
MEGFHPTPYREVPTLLERLGAAGFRRGCLGKVGHMMPKLTDRWETAVDLELLRNGRDPERYYEETKAFIEAADRGGTPFFLAANSHDPHRPFHGSEQEEKMFGSDPAHPAPSRIYAPEEVNVPDFLPDLPAVRQEIAEYYSSVRRLDDTVGAVLRALTETGHAEDTLVLFTTDHGMPLPFAKTNCWLHSTRTPMIARLPEGPGDLVHESSLARDIDIYATCLDAAGLERDEEADGRSLLPLLRGEADDGPTHRFAQFHQTAGRNRYPMRAVADERFLYIFNPWSDGTRVFKNESQAGRTFAAMHEAAETDPAVAERVRLFLHREVEELYDTSADPDCLRNLARDEKHGEVLQRLRGALRDHMARSGDRAVEALDHRDDPAALARFMGAEEAWGPRLHDAGWGLAADPRDAE